MTNNGLFPWFFQRISAAFLVAGLIVHFFVLHFMTERPITMEKVAERLKTPGWVAFDCVLLAICIYHAFNGIYSILLDFKPAKSFERIALYIFWIGGIAVTIFGVVSLVPFFKP